MPAPWSLEPVTRSKVLIVEGKDEQRLFSVLLDRLNLSNFDVRPLGGRDKLRPNLEALKKTSGFADHVVSLGVVRDADQNATRAFESVADALRTAGFERPPAPLTFSGDAPRVGVLILSADGSQGMLEDLCLQSVADDPAMSCVDDYWACIRERAPRLPTNPSKSRVRAFLASQEWSEIGYFEHLQQFAAGQPLPEPVEQSLPRAHTFLASRYKPDLDLGRAAQAGYWNFDHPAFAPLIAFLRML